MSSDAIQKDQDSSRVYGPFPDRVTAIIRCEKFVTEEGGDLAAWREYAYVEDARCCIFEVEKIQEVKD